MKIHSLFHGRRLSIGGVLGAAALLLFQSASPASPTPAPITVLQPYPDIPPVEKPRTVTRSLRLVQSSTLINAVTGRNSHSVNGSGLCAAILDTGINTTHSDFAGKIVLQKNYTSDNSGNTSNAEDGQGHGTNVAGIVAANGTHTGIAPGANLAVFKVLANTGSGSSAGILSALQWIRDNGDSYNISVVCMSLGDSSNAQTESAGDPYRTVIQQLSAKNIAVVVAAGNDFNAHGSAQGMSSPAIVRECISVGAVYDSNIGGPISYGSGAVANTTDTDRVTPFSQRLHSSVSSTNYTDIFAPGAALTSSGLGSSTASSVMHGTSQAAPIIAGSVLLFQQKYKSIHGTLPSVTTLETLMRSSGKTINDGDDENDNVTNTNQNYPRVDVKATLDAISTAPPTLSITGASVTETVGGATATLTVSISPAPSGTATVNWATTNGTATAGQDYTASSGSLSFSPTQTSQTISVPILDDGFVESAETFAVRLSSAVGAAVPSSATDGTVTITDNDTISITTPPSNVNFSNSGGTYTVRTETNSPGVSSVKVYRRPLVTALSTSPFAIPQGGTYGTQTVNISSTSLARKAYMLIQGNHPVPSELSIQLTTPSNVTYSLGTTGFPAAPWSVVFEFTSVLAGQSMAGNWTLRVTDNTNNTNSGSITSWGMLQAATTGTDTLISSTTYNSSVPSWDGLWDVSSTPNGYYSLVSRSFNASGVQLGEAINDRLLVQNANQAPVVSSVVLNNLAPRTKDSITATVTASDPENATLTYNYVWSINGTPKRTVTASASATDTLSLSAVAARGGDVVSLVVSATDATATSETLSPNPVTVIASAPVMATNSGLSVAQNAAATVITAARLKATDADDDTLTYTLSAVPSRGVLKLNGITLAVGGTFTQANIDANQLSFTPNGNALRGADGFTFSVSDGNGGTIAATTFAITITEAGSLKVTRIDDVTADDAKTSLREALAFAATLSGTPTITFDSTVFATSQTIKLTQGELVLDHNVILFWMIGSNSVSVSGDNLSRVFRVATGVTATVQNLSVVSGNAANSSPSNRGAAFYNEGTLVLSGCTLSGNVSTDGAAIYNGPGSSVTLTNCTLSGNTATAYGGALFNNTGGTVVLANSTVAGNIAGFGGGIVNQSSTMTVSNTIIAGNTGGTGPDVVGAFTSGGFNLIGNADNSTGFTATGDLRGTTASPLDARLNTLGSYGGPTATMSLKVDSPALDKGNPNFDATATPYDQRGTYSLRVRNGRLDIGAFEVQNDAPVAGADSYSATEDTLLTVNAATGLLANDTDPNTGATLSISGNSTPSNGTLTLNQSTGTFTYSPSANFNGSDSFTYTLSDGFYSATGTATINVSAVNDAPTISKPNAQAVDESSGSHTVTLTGIGTGASNEAGQTLTLSATSSNPQIVPNPTISGFNAATGEATLTFAPVLNASGSATITISVTDNGTTGGAADAKTTQTTFIITVNAVNDAPVAANDSYSTTKGTPLSVNAATGVLSNDTDNENNTLSVADNDPTTPDTIDPVTAPQHGTLVLNADGSFSYTPTSSYSGKDTFTYKASDGQSVNSLSNIATVTLTISSVAPVAVDDNPSTTEDTFVDINVVGNDTDADGDTLVVVPDSIGDVKGGSAQLQADGKTVRFTPDANANDGNTSGGFGFTYKVSDGISTSFNTATVTVNVSAANDDPVLTAVTIAPSAPKTNDTLTATPTATDVDGDTPSYSYVWKKNGVIISNQTGATLNLSLVGNGDVGDTIAVAVTANDGQGATASKESAAVTVQGSAPTVLTLSQNSVAENQPSGTTVGTFSTTDADSADTFTYALVAGTGDADNASFRIIGNQLRTASSFNFESKKLYSIRVKSTDAGGLLVESSFTINITNVNESPTATVTLSPSSPPTNALLRATATGSDPEGTSVSFSYIWKKNGVVLEGESTNSLNLSLLGKGDKGERISVSVVPSDGQLSGPSVTASTTVTNSAPVLVAKSFSGRENQVLSSQVVATDADKDALTYSVFAAPRNGILALQSSGAFTYTPKVNWHGTDSFTARVADSSGASVTALFTLNIASVNGVPVAVADVVKGFEDVPLTINASTLLWNDKNGENAGEVDALKIVRVVGTTGFPGTLALDATKQTILFTPRLNWNGTTTFTYTVQDSAGATATAQVTLQFAPVNDAPVAQSSSFVGRENQSISGQVRATDVDNDPVTFAVATLPRYGKLVLNTNGTFVYTPNALRNGSDSFTFRALDSVRAASAPATISLTVLPVNGAPVAVADIVKATEDQALFIPTSTLIANDKNGEAVGEVDALRVVGVSVPAGFPGKVVLDGANGRIVFTPNLNWNGTTSFSYTLEDSGRLRSTATVTVQVAPVNDVPSAQNASGSVQSGIALSLPLVATDVDGEALQLTLSTVPKNGTATLSLVNGQWRLTYRSRPGFSGTETFSFVAKDRVSTSPPATISLTITPSTSANPSASSS